MAVEIYENFLEIKLLDELRRYQTNLLKSKQHSLFTNMTWEQTIVLESAPVLIHTLASDTTLYEQIHQTITTKIEMLPKHIMLYTWTRFSYIPWHNDWTHKAGLTVYLNKSKTVNSGGIFLYKEDEQIKGIAPEGNQAVLVRGGVEHCVTPVISTGVLRNTLQVFF